MRGTIKRVVRDRGFGFIHADDGREIFFHHTSLQQLDFDSLKEERRLSLTWSARRRGREPSTCDPVGPEITAP
ncbi:MAG: cold-shock protein [Acidobacteria bacterium]|nr:MAG: cold-shock protein [Acidobacteriota bacterium]